MNKTIIIRFTVIAIIVLLIMHAAFFALYGGLIRRVRESMTDPDTGALSRNGFLRRFARSNAIELGRSAVISMQIAGLRGLYCLLDEEEYRRVLQQVFAALSAQLGADALVARTGDDSFCFTAKAANRDEGALKLQSVTRALAQIRAGRSGAVLAPRFGVCPCLAEGDTPEELLDRAVLARAHATKERPFRIYDAELDAERSLERQLIDALAEARTRGELTVCYQPKVSLAERRVAGAEVLIRWRHPQRGLLSPEMFVPLAERYGAAAQLDLFSFEEACRTIARWQEEGRELCPLSVNLSADSLRRADLPETLAAIGRRYHVPSGMIQLELAETLLAEDPDAAKELFEQLHAGGFRCAVDRFGSGLCATRLLGMLNPDTVKLDQSFFSGANNDRHGRNLLENAVRLAASLHARTVAVGVDSRGQVSYLQQVGCDDAQGFLFFRPMAGDRLDEAIYSGRELKTVPAAAPDGDGQKAPAAAEDAQSFRNVILFSCWPREDEVEFSEAFSPVLRGQTRFKNAAALFRTTALIHENDRKDFFRLLEISRHADGWTEGTLRFYVSELRYSWLDLRLRWERHGGTERISGMLVNMDGWRSEINRWKEKAERDVLTGLYNREHFEQVLGEQLGSGACQSAAVLFVDVDDLKIANDSYGHLFGDTLLCYVAKQMLAVFRHTDVIARYGGDEFVIFAPNVTREVLEQRLQKLYAAFRHPIRGDAAQYTASVSIGAALYPKDGTDAAALLAHADNALYEAKQEKNRCVFYEPHMKNATVALHKRPDGAGDAQ